MQTVARMSFWALAYSYVGRYKGINMAEAVINQILTSLYVYVDLLTASVSAKVVVYNISLEWEVDWSSSHCLIYWRNIHKLLDLDVYTVEGSLEWEVDWKFSHCLIYWRNIHKLLDLDAYTVEGC